MNFLDTLRMLCILVFSVMGATIALAEQIAWPPQDILNVYAYADNADSNQTDPVMDANNSGTVVTAWIDNDGTLKGSISRDAGESWDILSLPPETGNAPFVASKVLYAGNETWLIIWLKSLDGDGSDGANLYFTRSTDNGYTWSDTVQPHPDPLAGAPSDSRPQYGTTLDADTDKAGNVIIAYQTALLKSTDYGETWTYGPPQTGWMITGSDSRIASVGDGNWILMYRSTYFFDFNTHGALYVSVSADNGETWQRQPQLFDGYYRLTARDFLGDIYATEDIAVIVYRGSGLNLQSPVARYSLDKGRTWSAPMILLPFSWEDQIPFQASLAELDGHWLLTFGDRHQDILAFETADPRTTWTMIQPLAATERNRDSLSTVKGVPGVGFVATYQIEVQLAGALERDFDIAFKKLDTASMTWSDPGFVNPFATVDIPRIEDTSVDIAAGDHGVMVAVWRTQISRAGGSRGIESDKIIVARSTDFGRSFPSPKPLQTDYLTEVESDVSPRIFYCGEGRWLAAWLIGGDGGDCYYSISTDDAQTWGPPQFLVGERNPAIASNRSGVVLVAFRDEGRVKLKRSDDAGATWITLDDAPISFEVSLVHSEGATWFLSSNPDSLVSRDNGESWEVLADPPAHIGYDRDVATNHNGTLIAVDSLRSGSPNLEAAYADIFIRVSRDGGVTWTEPLMVQRNSAVFALPMLQPESHVKIAWLGANNWMAAWHKLQGSRDFAIDYQSQMRIEIVASSDGGETWSTPETISKIDEIHGVGHMLPAVAGYNGRAVVGWERVVTPAAVPDALGPDGDLLYTHTSHFARPSRATGWSLYE